MRRSSSEPCRDRKGSGGGITGFSSTESRRAGGVSPLLAAAPGGSRPPLAFRNRPSAHQEGAPRHLFQVRVQRAGECLAELVGVAQGLPFLLDREHFLLGQL